MRPTIIKSSKKCVTMTLRALTKKKEPQAMSYPKITINRTTGFEGKGVHLPDRRPVLGLVVEGYVRQVETVICNGNLSVGRLKVNALAYDLTTWNEFKKGQAKTSEEIGRLWFWRLSLLDGCIQQRPAAIIDHASCSRVILAGTNFGSKNA